MLFIQFLSSIGSLGCARLYVRVSGHWPFVCSTGEPMGTDRSFRPTGEPMGTDRSFRPTGEPMGTDRSFCPTGEPMGTDRSFRPTGEPVGTALFFISLLFPIEFVLSANEFLCLSPAFTLASCLAYSSTLKMEATCLSETSVDFQRTTRRYIPEDRILLAPPVVSVGSE
jgi:hypothetical protein